jgi:hypothetical protein
MGHFFFTYDVSFHIMPAFIKLKELLAADEADAATFYNNGSKSPGAI